jgi:Holliday junction resolvase RusA-like endonuclease
MNALRFIIRGNPAPKGNSPRLIPRGNQILRLPSKGYMRWFRAAQRQWPFVQLAARKQNVQLPIEGRVNVTAIWYCARWGADEDNMKKGLGDYLQRERIVTNDRNIHWTGETRIDKDRNDPRVEITVVGAQ